MGFMFRASAYAAKLPPGLYPGELIEIEEREGDHGGFLLWRFVVRDARDNEVEVTTISSQKFGAGSKARRYVEAILGREVQSGETLDAEALYNVPCQLLVTIAALTDGSSVNRVEQILSAAAKGGGDDDVPF
jgi:hypothetical protein